MRLYLVLDSGPVVSNERAKVGIHYAPLYDLIKGRKTILISFQQKPSFLSGLFPLSCRRSAAVQREALVAIAKAWWRDEDTAFRRNSQRYEGDVPWLHFRNNTSVNAFERSLKRFFSWLTLPLLATWKQLNEEDGITWRPGPFQSDVNRESMKPLFFSQALTITEEFFIPLVTPPL